MQDVTFELHLGRVTNAGGNHLSFSLKVADDGHGFLQIYAGSSDGRRSGTVMFLNEAEYNQLRSIIGKTDETIRELRRTGRMKQMRFLT